MVENLKIFQFKITDSTNLRAREYLKTESSLPALFVSDCQTAGRGRKGKSFYSPFGSGLYMSLVLPYDEELENNITITSASAVALLRVLKNHSNKTLSIKWVNDILADGKKVAGILCEAITDPEAGKTKAIIIGIGVNITTKSFPEELHRIATSLGEASVDNLKLATEISYELLKISKENSDSVMAEYRNLSAVLRKDIYYIKNGERFDAEVLEILNDGALRVRRFDNTEDILQSGEITLRIK